MKKTISILLSIVMILAMMPVCTGIAFAEEGLPLIAPNPVSVGEFYNVYLYSDGELLTMTSALDGTQVTPPAKDPQKDDYKFAGWYADETLQTEFDFSNPIKQDTNIYAKWKKLSGKSIKSGLEKTSITAKSKLAKSSSGKDGIKITWEKAKGCKVDYYQIQRATSKDGKYETVYTTKSGNASSYVNTKNLKSGKKYYYRVRGVRTVNGKKVYTKWGKCYRTFKSLTEQRLVIIHELTEMLCANNTIANAATDIAETTHSVVIMLANTDHMFNIGVSVDGTTADCDFLRGYGMGGAPVDSLTVSTSDLESIVQWVADYL